MASYPAKGDTAVRQATEEVGDVAEIATRTDTAGREQPARKPPREKVRRRANGEGSIYHVESEGRWRAALTWTDDAGVKRRRLVTGPTMDAVRRKLTSMRSDLDRGRPPSSGVTLATFLGCGDEYDDAGRLAKAATGWLAREKARLRPATWRQREQYIRTYIAPHLGKIRLGKLAPTDVERMTSALVARGLSPQTAAHARVVLRRALSDAERDGLVHRNAAALARPPRVPSRSMEAGRDYLDAAQLRTLLTTAEGHALGPLVTVAATTGLRQGELLGLSWGDVDPDHGTLTVRRSMARSWDREKGWELAEPKTERSRRTIGLPARARVALAQQRSAQETTRLAYEAVNGAGRWRNVSNLVFTDSLGDPLRSYNVTRVFHEILRGAGLPSVPFHALRHSAATALLTAGVPLRVVADVLGHSTISITADTYAAVVPELRREAADAMDRALG